MSKKIYIIEDDANLLYGLQSRFSSEGYEVEITTGEETLEELLAYIKKSKFDYVILDLILPDLDGFELLEAIRSEDELKDLSVFVFTDLSDEDSKNRSMELGADYYFIKTDFDINEFSEKVIRILNNKQNSGNGF
ncbi:MAG TPA: response regulator [Patescibacteria group bacterium]|nr:response regulator [Patescibacteria group bacterium]